MGERNAGREIAISLGVAAVLGGGIAAYVLSSTADLREAARVARTQAETPIASSVSRATTRSDEASRIAAAFVSHLASSEYHEAYELMAGAYRQTTSFEAFRGTCAASPFLSTVRSVSLSKTHQEFAPGQKTGSLTASGVMSTGAGTVDVTFFYVDDGTSFSILNITMAGASVLPMDRPAPPARNSSPSPKNPNRAKSASGG